MDKNNYINDLNDLNDLTLDSEKRQILNEDFFIEEEDISFEIAGTWGSAGTFGSTVGGCASTVGTASSFG